MHGHDFKQHMKQFLSLICLVIQLVAGIAVDDRIEIYSADFALIFQRTHLGMVECCNCGVRVGVMVWRKAAVLIIRSTQQISVVLEPWKHWFNRPGPEHLESEACCLPTLPETVPQSSRT